jgi:hypothetical protein
MDIAICWVLVKEVSIVHVKITRSVPLGGVIVPIPNSDPIVTFWLKNNVSVTLGNMGNKKVNNPVLEE